MNYYKILGVPENATQVEIKKAYRREAMKCHPDRNSNSPGSKLRFQEIAQAYKTLSDVNLRNEYDAWLHPEPNESYDSSERYHEESEYQREDPNPHEEPASDSSSDDYADTIFWEEMLDFAIELAAAGMQEEEIYLNLSRKGCPNGIAKAIAKKSFQIHQKYSGTSTNSKQKEKTHKRPTKKIPIKLYEAFIGEKSLFLSRNSKGLYLDKFQKFDTRENLNFITSISFSFPLLIATILLSPIPTLMWIPGRRIRSLPLPFNILMLGILSISFLVAVFGVYLPPNSLANFLLSFTATLYVLLYIPALMLCFYGRFIYYRYALLQIECAEELTDSEDEKIAWLKSRGGRSLPVKIITIAGIILVTGGGILNQMLDQPTTKLEPSTTKQNRAINQTSSESKILNQADVHFNSEPPDFKKALELYTRAADKGSIYGAYATGYMHYFGEGVVENGNIALKYFDLVTKSSPASQGQYSNIEKEYVANSFNYLGLIYQYGYGTNTDIVKSVSMYNKAIEYGSYWAKYNLGKMSGYGTTRQRDYDKAILLFSDAAIHEIYPAFVELALIYGDPENYESYDYKISFNYLMEAVGKSDGEAEYYLGFIFESDDLGQKKDIRSSISWYEKSISQGSSEVSRDYINNLKKQL